MTRGRPHQRGHVPADQIIGLGLMLSSTWIALSLSRTNCLVCPETFRRRRLPSGAEAE
jgi:hypothetical protein